MSTVRSEYNFFSAPALSKELLAASPLIESCHPHLYSIMASSLGAIHYAARDNPRLLTHPILGDGLQTIVDEPYTAQALKGPYTESLKGILPYAVSAARVVGTAVAVSKLIGNSQSTYATSNTRRRGGRQTMHHMWELDMTGIGVKKAAKDLFIRRNIASLGVYFTTIHNQPTYDLRLSAHYSKPSADILDREASFASIQLTSNVYPSGKRPKEALVTTSVASGTVADGFVHIQQEATFAALDPFCKLINHLIKTT